MTARRMNRTCQLQIENGVYRYFRPGQVVVAEDPDAVHWFVIENSEPHEDAPVVVADETDEELADDAKLEASGVTKGALLIEAASLGIAADRRWSIARLQASVDAAKAI